VSLMSATWNSFCAERSIDEPVPGLPKLNWPGCLRASSTKSAITGPLTTRRIHRHTRQPRRLTRSRRATRCGRSASSSSTSRCKSAAPPASPSPGPTRTKGGGLRTELLAEGINQIQSVARLCAAHGEEIRFALDSALEGAGFEPSVPRQESRRFEPASVPRRGGRCRRGGYGPGGDRRPDRRPPMARFRASAGKSNKTVSTSWSFTGDRWFESISLQRRVSCELDPTASATCLPASHAPAPPANADSGFAFLLYRWRLCRVSGIAV